MKSTWEIFNRLRAKLAEEHDKRLYRRNWFQAELEAMLNAVNEERKERGRDPVTMDDIKRVEMEAVGHVDYAVKFSWSCAELATR